MDERPGIDRMADHLDVGTRMTARDDIRELDRVAKRLRELKYVAFQATEVRVSETAEGQNANQAPSGPVRPRRPCQSPSTMKRRRSRRGGTKSEKKTSR